MIYIRLLNYQTLRDICLRLKYYPESFKVYFFCTNSTEIENFITFIKKEIDSNIQYKENVIGNNKVSFYFYTDVNKYICHGKRANIAIVSAEYSYKSIQDIILPMTYLTPGEVYIYGCRFSELTDLIFQH